MPIAGIKPTKTAKPDPRKPGNKIVLRQFNDQRQPLPTQWEITEGRAWVELQQYPDDEDAKQEYSQAFNMMQCNQNRQVPLLRCLLCGVLVHGRKAGEECGHCGEILTREYWNYLADHLTP